MKKVEWCIVTVTFFCLICLSAQALGNYSWGQGTYLDEFGDRIEGNTFITTIDPVDGTFSNSATRNSEMSVQVMYDQYGFSLIIYPYKRESNEYFNSSSRQDKFFTVKIKDQKNDVHSFFGFMFCNDNFLHIVEKKSIYNRISKLTEIKEGDYHEILDLFSVSQLLKFSITENDGNDSFNFQINTAGFSKAAGLADRSTPAQTSTWGAESRNTPIKVKATSEVWLRDKNGTSVKSIPYGTTFQINAYDNSIDMFQAYYDGTLAYVKGTALLWQKGSEWVDVTKENLKLYFVKGIKK